MQTFCKRLCYLGAAKAKRMQTVYLGLWDETAYLCSRNPKKMRMKKNQSNRVAALLAAVILVTMNVVNAEAKAKTKDKDLAGLWVLSSLMYEGEDENHLGDNYTRVKAYGADGEYACAQIVKLQDGTYQVLPHEYGKYTFKNGKYTEMGRDGKLELVDNGKIINHYLNLIEEWRKVTDIPDELVKFVVNKCKCAQLPSEKLQLQLRKYVFNAGEAEAQGKPVDMDIIGVWAVTSIGFEGEEPARFSGADYARFKYYGSDGVYACAEVLKDGSGSCVVRPHEYGTYSFGNGKYIEMGREGELTLADKVTFVNRWGNQIEEWKKVTDIPSELTKYLVETCKEYLNYPEGIQSLIHQYLLK